MKLKLNSKTNLIMEEQPFSKILDDSCYNIFWWWRWIILQNGWLTKHIKSYFQPGPLSEILTIASLWHATSRIWTCPEHLGSGFIEWIFAVVITTSTWRHNIYIYVLCCVFVCFCELISFFSTTRNNNEGNTVSIFEFFASYLQRQYIRPWLQLAKINTWSMLPYCYDKKKI